MKEYEENNINTVDQLSSLSVKAQLYKLKSFYDNAKTLEDKLTVLVDMQVYATALDYRGIYVSEEIVNLFTKLNQEFRVTYIDKGDHESRRRVFEAIGILNGKLAHEQYNMKSDIYKKFDSNVAHREEKSCWIVKNSTPYFTAKTLAALRVFFVFAHDSKKIQNAEAKEFTIYEETTMEELAYRCGYTKENVDEFYTKNKCTKDTTIIDYYKARGKDPYTDEGFSEIIQLVSKKLTANQPKMWMNNATTEYYKKKELTPVVIERANKLFNASTDSFTKEKEVRNWSESEGKQILQETTVKNTKTIIDNYNNNYLVPKVDNTKEINRRIASYKAMYNKLTSVEDKVDFFVTLDEIVTERATLTNEDVDAEYDLKTELTKDFINKYLINGDAKTIRKIVKAMGNLAASNNIELMRLEEKYLSLLDAEVPNREIKARYLARSERGARIEALRVFEVAIHDVYSEDIRIHYRLGDDVGASTKMSMREFALKAGIKENELEEFYNKYNTTGDTAAHDYFRNILIEKWHEEPPEDFISDELTNTLAREIYITSMKAGAAEAKARLNFDQSKEDQLQNIRVASNRGFDTTPIDEWIESTGKTQGNVITSEHYMKHTHDFYDKFDTSVSYDKYINLHTGVKIMELPLKEQKEYLAKAIAADLLKDSKIFDLDKIHAVAKNIRAMAGYNELVNDQEQLTKALTGLNGLKNASDKLVNTTYKISDDKLDDYIDKMNTLADNLQSSKGRSDEYKAFFNSVKRIAELKNAYDLKHPKDREAATKDLIVLNANLIDSIRVYTKGKKAVRKTKGGRARFNNTLDALSILSANVTGAKGQVDLLIDRVNKVRFSFNEVELNNYNENRAATNNKQAKQPQMQAK